MSPYPTTPEGGAREKIDQLLISAGWIIQDYKDMNLSAGPGIAIREFPVTCGSADYMLFIDRKAAGVIEAKPEGTTLSGVSEQSFAYQSSVPAAIPAFFRPLPFGYESTGKETFFRCERDPEPRSRSIFAFHKPETLREWMKQEETIRSKFRHIPPLIVSGLRDCQVEAITNLEESMANDRSRALVQMATGSGKTFTAVSFIYRMIKFCGIKRVLFLVDRSNLGRQTLKEFQNYTTPDDGRKFTELYNVQHLSGNKLDPVSRVCITTIQRMYSILQGDEEFDEQFEEGSQFDNDPDPSVPIPVTYNPAIPIEMFDIVITDECHRSIYHLWRQVLEYYDSYIIGLTATPSKQTLGYFGKNLVMEYPHERAVMDGVNVGFEVYRIKTKVSSKGGKVDKGFWVDKRDTLTREVRWELVDDVIEYNPKQLDRDVVVPAQIWCILEAYKKALFTDLFPGRIIVPKTIIFAKDDSHAEDIVRIAREVFGKGNDFCKKITYRTYKEKPEDLIRSFANSYDPRIAVTVDMIATGTDIRAVECILFMRDVKSEIYFDQMWGRGTRTINETDLQSVTPDASCKTLFYIIDAVGVTEERKRPVKPLERKRSVSFEKLLMNLAMGVRNNDTISTFASRLSRLDQVISESDRFKVKEVTGGKSLKKLSNSLYDAIDPDKQITKAKELSKIETPTPEQIEQAREELIINACLSFDDPKVRNVLIEIKKKSEQIIDTISGDEIIDVGFDPKAREKAVSVVRSFTAYIEEHKDEIEALMIIYSRPYGQQHLTYQAIQKLSDSLIAYKPAFRTDNLWKAYAQLEKDRVKDAGPQILLTDIVSLVRFAIGQVPVLEPFEMSVDEKFGEWIAGNGHFFSDEQVRWLEMIRDHIGTSLSIEIDDLDNQPFSDRGGRVKAIQLFGAQLKPVMQELSEVLAG